MTSILKSLCLGTAIALSATPAFAATTPHITLSQEFTAISQSSNYYKRKATDVVQITTINDANLDKAYTGAASLKILSDFYWIFDGTNVFANALCGGAWKTFSANIVSLAGAGWTTGSLASPTVVIIPETVSDGVGTGSGWSIHILLSTIGSQTLTGAALGAYLAKSTTKTLGTTATSVASSAPLTAGWTVRLLGYNATPSAIAMTLDPETATLNWSITPNKVGATALTYSTNITNLHTWNLAQNSTTAKTLNFSNLTGGGSAFTLNAFPGNFGRSNGSMFSAFMYKLSTFVPNRIHYSSSAPGFYNPLPTAIADLQKIVLSSTSLNIQQAFNAILANSAASPLLLSSYTAYPTTDGSNYTALVALTASNIINVTWSTNGSQIIATGQVGASGAQKQFICDVDGFTMYDSTMPIASPQTRLLTFQSKDDDAFFAWSLIAHGLTGALDTSGLSLPPASESDILASYIAGQLNAVSTIGAQSLETIFNSAY